MKAPLLYSLFTLLMFLGLQPAKADYPFNQDFEFDGIPAGWTVFNVQGDITWASTTEFNQTPEGSRAMMHNFGMGMQDGWLVSPQISMPQDGYFFLSFWSMVGDIPWYHKNSVWVSTGSADPASGDYVEVWVPAEVLPGWDQVFIDLEAWAGQNIYFAFRYEGDYAHYWIVDDVSLGEPLDVSPSIQVTPAELQQSVAQGGTASNRLVIRNEGVGTLHYEIALEYIDAQDWLGIEPLSGSVSANSLQIIQLSFQGMGLDFGPYHAEITVSSNDENNPEVVIPVTMNVMDATPVNVVVLQSEYTFPVAISENGKYVVGTPFGGQSGYFWSEETGTINLAAAPDGVSNNGTVAVTFDNPDLLFQGNPVNVAGRWSVDQPEFAFIGMNPAVPQLIMTDYNSAWGMSADGKLVGMQVYQGYNVKAFSWTEEGGYDNIGNHPSLTSSNRPNGITANGEVVYGWAQTELANRSPVIWYNGEVIFIDETMPGEANGGSPSGQYITGSAGGEGFVWNKETQQISMFANTINDGNLVPMTVTEQGYVFGFTAEGFPPLPDWRRAFVRDPNGNLMTFNDYAVNRGWFDAADWTFFAVSGVSGDGNRLIGAGIDPDGSYLSFMVDFNPSQPGIEVSPLGLAQSLDAGEQATQHLEIENIGTGNLVYNAIIQYIDADAKVQQAPAGRQARTHDMALSAKKGTDGFHPATKHDKSTVTLNYDGANVDAIGLLAGGTFYGAARYPSAMVAPFGGYLLESVDVYIGDIPTQIRMMIWDAGTTTTPGSLLHEQVFTPLASSWQTITLDEALAVSGADLWVGFEITHDAGVFVLGLGAGDTNMNGNWLSQDAVVWEHLSDYGLPGNWNIRANLQYDGIAWLSLDPAQGIIDEGGSATMAVHFDAASLNNGSYSANIRLHSNAVNEQLVIIPVNLEVSGALLYNLSLFASPEHGGQLEGAGQYYAGEQVSVIAVAHEDFVFEGWTDAENQPLSESAEYSFIMPAHDLSLTAHFETTISVGQLNENSLQVYPNPAREQLNISSGQIIDKLEMFSLTGQKVYVAHPAQTSHQIKLAGYHQGIYLLRIFTSQGIQLERVQICR